MLDPIQDYLRKDMIILFVGYNPSIKSGISGHHYANPTNRFYTILHKAGFTDRKFDPTEDRLLIELGYGLTNIVERPTRAASDIRKEEYDEGRVKLKKKIQYYKPKIVCFVGKGVYQEYSKKRSIHWGVQQPSVDGIVDFVAPSSSGLVRMKIDEIVGIYKQIHILMD
jgi:TDG/mug DNA glycosylase family protein